ncbi:MAG: hypothetical protein JNN15_00055 [Blastocatellia bacterium]|nr:hypothetical protein [Blastocatellia bacterium]
MKELSNIDSICEAKYEIELWLLGWETFQIDGSIVNVENITFSVEFGKFIFSYWTDEKSESWRVIAYSLTDKLLILRLGIALQKKSKKTIIYPSTDPATLPAKEALSCLKTVISESLGWTVKTSTIGRSNQYGYSSKVARLLLENNGYLIAAVAIFDLIEPALLLAQAFNWFSVLKERIDSINCLAIFIPSSLQDKFLCRLGLTYLKIDILIFGFDLKSCFLQKLSTAEQGDFGFGLTGRVFGDLIAGFQEERYCRAIDSFEEIVGKEFRSVLKPFSDRIEVLKSSDGEKLKFLVNGLEIARYQKQLLTISLFSRDGFRRELFAEHNQEQFRNQLEEIFTYRIADSPNKQHPFYSLQQERWLEAVVRGNIQSLDPELDSKIFYCQVPAIKDFHSRYVDIVARRKDGQIVLIELKVTESVELPFQALDYWTRFEWYRTRGDLQNWFSDSFIKDSPAVVYLVAPIFCFHKSFKLFTSFIGSTVELYKIAINQSWHSGLKVLLKDRLDYKE